MGWRGSSRHWRRYQDAYLLLAGLATPLVVSVHTIVSFDFAVGIVPGWHETIFPPYFVAGAIYSGFEIGRAPCRERVQIAAAAGSWAQDATSCASDVR